VVGRVVRRSGEIVNDNAAHARARVGRDQFENLIEFKLKSERTVQLSPHDVCGLEQTGAPLLGHLAKHFLTGLNHLPLPALGRLFVETTPLHLGEDARLFALPLKAAQCLLEGLIVANCDSSRHEDSPPLGADCAHGVAASWRARQGGEDITMAKERQLSRAGYELWAMGFALWAMGYGGKTSKKRPEGRF
jgi:hypothetical protein